MWEQVQKASSRNANILEEAFNSLDEEQETDEALRSKYTSGNDVIVYNLVDVRELT